MTDFIKELRELGAEIETGDPDETQLIVLGKQGAEWASDAVGVSEAEKKPVTETMTYYGAHNPDGTLYGIFREYLDNVERRYGFERFTDGEWVDDPSLLLEKREPGVRPISPEVAQRFLRSRP